jgi:8-hydroxy-5-deazaflavin:NADPH oxidoreductase
MKIAVLGSGTVGEVLANGFLKHGYEVVRGSRDPGKLADWLAQAGERAGAATFADAARDAQVIVLAVKGSAAIAALDATGLEHLDGKVVVDATNPIADAAPEQGVLRFFTSLDDSLMEQLQRHAPKARFVKAFSCVGNAFMVNPSFPGGPPTMFICGDDEAAKAWVRTILGQFGWEVEDLGAVTAARAIEPLCILWCIPGLRGGSWAHAFKLLKLQA